MGHFQRYQEYNYWYQGHLIRIEDWNKASILRVFIQYSLKDWQALDVDIHEMKNHMV